MKKLTDKGYACKSNKEAPEGRTWYIPHNGVYHPNKPWDEAVSDSYIENWNKCKRELQLLEGLEINRCFKPSKFGKVIDCSLHHFSGASQDGSG